MDGDVGQGASTVGGRDRGALTALLAINLAVACLALHSAFIK